MEMLAEMEGTEEDLKGLNHAEHNPEDDMHTDEWMYELKHRKSWTTGKYVPSDDSWKPKKELLTDSQVQIVKTTWEGLDALSFGKTLHGAIAIEKPSEVTDPLDVTEQSQQIASILSTTVNNIDDPSKLPTAELQKLSKAYDISGAEIVTVFAEHALQCLGSLINPFTPTTQTAWKNTINLLISTSLESAK